MCVRYRSATALAGFLAVCIEHCFTFNAIDKCSWTLKLNFDNAQQVNAYIDVKQLLTGQSVNDSASNEINQTTFVYGSTILLYLNVTCATLFGSRSKCSNNLQFCSFSFDAPYLIRKDVVPQLIKSGYLFTLSVDPSYFSTVNTNPQKEAARTKEYALRILYKPTFTSAISFPVIKYTIAGEVTSRSIFSCVMGEGLAQGISPTINSGQTISCRIECVGYGAGSGRITLGPIGCSPLQFERPLIKRESDIYGSSYVDEGDEYGRFGDSWLSNIDVGEMEGKNRNTLTITYTAGNVNENTTLCFETRMRNVSGSNMSSSLITNGGMTCFEVNNYNWTRAIYEWTIVLVILLVFIAVCWLFLLKNN